MSKRPAVEPIPVLDLVKSTAGVVVILGLVIGLGYDFFGGDFYNTSNDGEELAMLGAVGATALLCVAVLRKYGKQSGPLVNSMWAIVALCAVGLLVSTLFILT